MTIWRRLLGDRRLWAIAALLAVVAIAWGSLLPGNALPSNLPWDKFNHFVAYGVLATLVHLAGTAAWPAWLIVSGYGIAIEYAQTAVPGRLGGDVADMLANALGAALALLAVRAARRFWGGG